MRNGVEIIAEVKNTSPFKGRTSEKSWDELFEIAASVGDIISVHTNPRWGGSFDLVKRARSLTAKPILAKGIHESDDMIERAIECGADWVLVVVNRLRPLPKAHLHRCLIEPTTLEELKTIPNSLRAVWNSRDLSNGGFKQETFEQARGLFSGWLCQASNLTTVADIKPGADAVLVGTNLLQFAESLK